MCFMRRLGFLLWAAGVEVLLSVSAAMAQGGTGPTGQAPGGLFAVLSELLPMFAIVFLIFYFMIIRPQQQKLLEHKKLIESLKKGDNVVTSGGILGRVASVDKDHILLEVAGNVKIRFETAHVQRRSEKPGSQVQGG